MRSIGIVAEYNPFHSGHKYQIDAAKEVSQADAVVIAMSGACVQRGYPASFSKLFRAEEALQGGADLVVDLPVVYSAQSAQAFAQGSIRTLLEAGVDAISFGVETREVDRLKTFAELLAEEPEEYQRLLKEGLSAGMRYPRARERALSELTGEDASILRSPNNILALEYLKELYRLGDPVEVYPILRKGADYHDEQTNTKQDTLSATAIRKAIKEGALEEIHTYVRDEKELNEAYLHLDEEKYLEAIQFRLSMIDPDELELYPYMGQGLSEKLKKIVKNGAIYEIKTLADLLDRLVSKDTTKASIQRALLMLVLDLTKSDLRAFTQPYYRPVLRPLAMNEKGREILKQAKKKEATILATPSTDLKKLNALQRRAWDFEERACRLQDLFFKQPQAQTEKERIGQKAVMRTVPLVMEKEEENE